MNAVTSDETARERLRVFPLGEDCFAGETQANGAVHL